MTYENSKTAKVLKTSCSCCNRVLVDAVSLELEMGPICRSRLGINLEMNLSGSQLNKVVQGIQGLEDVNLRFRVMKALSKKGPQEAANKLVHHALKDQGVESMRAVVILKDLGFENVAEKLATL